MRYSAQGQLGKECLEVDRAPVGYSLHGLPRAYDRFLVLVIDKNPLFHEISSLFCWNLVFRIGGRSSEGKKVALRTVSPCGILHDLVVRVGPNDVNFRTRMFDGRPVARRRRGLRTRMITRGRTQMLRRRRIRQGSGRVGVVESRGLRLKRELGAESGPTTGTRRFRSSSRVGIIIPCPL